MEEIKIYPDKWVVIEITSNNIEPLRKVFGSWERLDGAWKLNSGIKSVKIEDDYIVFTGYSGKNYYCKIGAEGIASAAQAEFDAIIELASSEHFKIEVIEGYYKNLN